MHKNKSVKIAVILIGLIALAAGIILIVHFVSKKNDTYRSILIYELEGRAEIEREGAGTIAAANHLYLESGDKVRLDKDSSMRLKLDDDKYIMVEENSVLAIQAEGSDTDSRTSIRLEQGAITNEIQNKLTEPSAYEVNSPNSIMAVRGTIFRTEGYLDEEGQNLTKVSTFDGTVAFQPIAPDGTKQEEILIEAGKEAVIRSTPDGIQYLKEPSDIAFSELPLQALHFLQDRIENGAPITGISSDTLQKLIQESENRDTTDPGSDSEGRDPSGQSNTPTPTSSKQSSPTQTPSGQQTSPTKTPSGQQASPTKTPSGQQASPTRTPSGQQASPTKTPSGQGTDKNKIYTVTFRYQGKTFGVQTVENGHTASKPKLSPASKGRWDFDFSQKIHKNIVINWISG